MSSFACECCNYKTNNKSNFNKHIKSTKHINNSNGSIEDKTNINMVYDEFINKRNLYNGIYENINKMIDDEEIKMRNELFQQEQEEFDNINNIDLNILYFEIEKVKNTLSKIDVTKIINFIKSLNKNECITDEEKTQEEEINNIIEDDIKQRKLIEIEYIEECKQIMIIDNQDVIKLCSVIEEQQRSILLIDENNYYQELLLNEINDYNYITENENNEEETEEETEEEHNIKMMMLKLDEYKKRKTPEQLEQEQKDDEQRLIRQKQESDKRRKQLLLEEEENEKIYKGIKAGGKVIKTK